MDGRRDANVQDLRRLRLGQPDAGFVGHRQWFHGEQRIDRRRGYLQPRHPLRQADQLSSNPSPSPNGVSGGAIGNSGQLTVTTSVFTNNQAQEGASIFNQNTMTINQ